jgi:hypothetical protein
MKSNSKRNDRPPPEFNVDEVKELYDTQGGMCHYLNIHIKAKRGDKDPFNMSQERLVNSIHYTKINTVFICAFLQVSGPFDISAKETRDLIYYDQRTDNYVFDEDDLKALFYKEREPHRPNGEPNPVFGVDGNVVSKSCTVCNTSLPIAMFSDKKPCCKSCHAAYNTENTNTPRGFVNKMKNSAELDAERRSKKRKRNDTSGDVEDKLFDVVVKMILRQGNRCAITGIPFVYRMKNTHSPSICRADKSKGCTSDNFQIIVSPLNTRMKPSNEVFAKIRAHYFSVMKQTGHVVKTSVGRWGTTA